MSSALAPRVQNVTRRILTNLVIIAAAVGITYVIGIVTKALFGTTV